MVKDIDLAPVKSDLCQARYLIGQAINKLYEAADLVKGTEYEKSIVRWYEHLDSYSDEIYFR